MNISWCIQVLQHVVTVFVFHTPYLHILWVRRGLLEPLTHLHSHTFSIFWRKATWKGRPLSEFQPWMVTGYRNLGMSLPPEGPHSLHLQNDRSRLNLYYLNITSRSSEMVHSKKYRSIFIRGNQFIKKYKVIHRTCSF